MPSNNQQVFLELVRAGLWETDVKLRDSKDVDYNEVYRLAEKQSVFGLVAAGLEHVEGVKVSQEVALTFAGRALQLECRNREMNSFVASVTEEMRTADIYGVLVKGSGLAQCYERPLWRSFGDVDFFFSDKEYDKAVSFFASLKNAKEVQNAHYTKSFGVIIDPWFIELHGTLRNGLSTRMDKEIDAVQRDLFYGGNVRSWDNNGTTIFLPSPDNDVFLVFVHFVRHFFKEGVCLRQICDWCRLLWTFRGEINIKLLKKRLIRAGLIKEWRAFAAMAVDYLGMPSDAFPLYSTVNKWHKKGRRIMDLILHEGEHGKVRNTLHLAIIFPWNTIQFLPSIFFNLNGLKIKERLLSHR